MEDLEKIAKYRTIIKEILGHYASYKPSHGATVYTQVSKPPLTPPCEGGEPEILFHPLCKGMAREGLLTRFQKLF